MKIIKNNRFLILNVVILGGLSFNALGMNFTFGPLFNDQDPFGSRGRVNNDPYFDNLDQPIYPLDGEITVARMPLEDADINSFIATQGDINASQYQGNSFLHELVYDRNIQGVRALLRAGASVNIRNEHGKTPLYKAVMSSNLPIVQLLINAGADVRISNEDGITPLHLAVHRNNPDIVQAIIDTNQLSSDSVEVLRDRLAHDQTFENQLQDESRSTMIDILDSYLGFGGK